MPKMIEYHSDVTNACEGQQKCMLTSIYLFFVSQISITLPWSSLLLTQCVCFMPTKFYFKKCITFTYFIPKMCSSMGDWRLVITFLCYVSFPYRCYVPNLAKFLKRCKRTPHDNANIYQGFVTRSSEFFVFLT